MISPLYHHRKERSQFSLELRMVRKALSPDGEKLQVAKVRQTWTMNNWLVVLTILKNISQWEGLSHILWQWKIKNVPNHQPDKIASLIGYENYPLVN